MESKQYIGEVLKKSYVVDYKRLTRNEYQPFLTQLFEKVTPLKLTFREVLAELARMVKLDETGMYRRAKLWHWKELFDSIKLKERENKAEAEIAALAPKLPAAAKFSDIIHEVKEFSFLMIKTNQQIANTHTQMIEHFTWKITQLIEEKGGVRNFTKDDERQIELYSKNVALHHDAIKEFTKPGQIASMLKMVGIEQAVPESMRDIDQHAFTMERLQKTFYEEMGYKPLFGDEAAITATFKQYDTEDTKLPDIKGYR